jgi:hypothetical protein
VNRRGKGPISDWLSSWRARVLPRADAAHVPSVEPVVVMRSYAGEYKGLYKYLRDRYANRVVLTFGEIEDLVGFSLPGPARLQTEWWAGSDAVAHRTAQSDSWTLASRTATVNLAAQNVLFERHA